MSEHFVYIRTLDSHNNYGPFWPAAGHSSYWWAHSFADEYGLAAYTVTTKEPTEPCLPIAIPLL